ncbi:MAG: mechanosensitive ion channel family protein, partial [Gammaproteobacteria bacterium]|nr:mechanosensitive ion channel family protein [Gammaproteobacteria bacterium]
WLFAKIREQDELRWVGLLMAVVLVVSLGAEWSGYRNLALTMLRFIIGSLFAFGVVLTLMRLFHELYDALEQGVGPRPLRLRQLLNVAPNRPVPGLVWFRIATNVLLWSLFGYTLLRIWHVSAGTLTQIENSLFRGFKLGDVQIVPLRILLAIALFAVLVTLARWLQTRLDRRWLTYARMDHGAREAVVTITGYVLVVLAAILGLSVAGFDFGKLAIIAGALSVGIGFGLQNIVNNFVSGLILLFERPVKTGDWVVVGDTEGYVRRISIRSTQIQTFDHADVIVPNSELIARQVTNWTLHNRQGRLHIPIGVAYGSDIEKVKQVLEHIGIDHPSVITDGSVPNPKALFLGFGETALNFDLRCFVRNIDERAQIVSDLNSAIYAAFRAEGIDMPFPNKPVPPK